MYRLVDDTIDMFLKAAFEVTRLFIILITTLGIIMGDFQYYNIYSFSFAAIILSYFLSHLVIKHSRIDSKVRLAIPIAGILFSILVVYFAMGDEFQLTKVALSVYFFMIWRKGIGLAIEKEDIDTYRFKFVVSLLVVLVLGCLLLAMGLLEWYVGFLKNFFIIYIIVSGVFLARISLQDAYNKRNTNVINKNKNILIFNGISLAIILVLLLIVFTDFFGIANLNAIDYVITWIGKILGILIYPIIWIGVKLFSKIKIDFSRIPQLQALGEQGSSMKEQYTEEYKDGLIANLAGIGKWVVIAIIIVVAFYLIYKTIKGMYLSKSQIVDEGEEKDFVLGLKDITNQLKKPFMDLLNKTRNKFRNKSSSYVDLPLIRRMYIDVLIKLKNEGLIYKRYHTPNEYLNEVLQGKYDGYGIDTLTKYYNDVRYGKKTISEESINEAERIKNRIIEKK